MEASQNAAATSSLNGAIAQEAFSETYTVNSGVPGSQRKDLEARIMSATGMRDFDWLQRLQSMSAWRR